MLNPKIKTMFKDLYEGMSEGEAAILDIVIANFILREVMNVKSGEEATERQIAAVTGLSKSGARVVSDKAMQRIKSKFVKGGVSRISDWVPADRARQVGNAVSGYDNNID